MQLVYQTRWEFFARRAFGLLAAAGILVSAGCTERPTTIDPAPERPHAGVRLTVAADPAHRELARQLGRAWAARSGADVQVLDGPRDGQADVGLISPAELPRWAEAGRLAEAPAALRLATNPYRWDDVLEPYTARLTRWGDRVYALPVLGEGMVLVYRRAAFDGQAGRPTPPATWDDLLAAAGTVAGGKPSLPPAPTDPERLGAEFFAAAASYDRLAVGRIAGGQQITAEFFAFQIDPSTGAPRLDAPAFRHAAGLFRQLAQLRCPGEDAPAAFNSGAAVLGVLSLDELGRLRPAVVEGLGVAPLPGARFTFDGTGERRPTEQQTVNRVPYVGWGGRVGVVSAGCAAPAAAWDFLADLGMPDRTALELIAAPRWGAGPYRTSQFDNRARPRWHAYGLPPDETDRLVEALRTNTGSGVVQNYRVRVRTPNQHELAAPLHDELRRVFRGERGDLAAANERWKAVIGAVPPADWTRLVWESLGVARAPGSP